MSLESQSIAAKPNRFARWYSRTAIIFLNVFVLFILLNLACAAILLSRSKNDRPASLDAVASQSFRATGDDLPWPINSMNYNVFFFGGSATQGVGLRDDQTIPAHFQSLMQAGVGQRVCVYNFGRRGCDSTRQRILFEQLLADGARPDLVVFIGGIEDFASAGDATSSGKSTGLIESLPIVQATQWIGRQSNNASPDFRIVDSMAITHYQFNKTAIESIAKFYDINTLFVFQPAPVYQCDPPAAKTSESDGGTDLVRHGYPLMARFIKDNRMGGDFLWLADIQRAAHTPLYLDAWNYNPDFAGQIADRIFNFMQKVPDSAPQAQVGDAK